MKTGQKFCAQRGTVLVFALLILVVGGTILGGIAQLAVTQSIAGQAEWEAVERRVQTENSRVLARQYILTQMWQGFGGLPAATLNNSATGGLGGFQITSVEPDFGYWLSVTQDDTNRINPFNLFERGGFQSAWANGLLRTRSDDSSTNNANWGFQIRTRSPIAAGFAFVNHWNAANTWSPAQRINMRQTNGPNFYATGYAALPRVPVSSVTNTNTGDTNGFLGFLALPRAEAEFALVLDVDAETGILRLPEPVANSVKTNELTTNTAQIAIDLGIYNYGSGDSPRFYEVPSQVDIDGPHDVTELLLTNGYGVNVETSAVQILIPESRTNFNKLILSGNNPRAVYLYRQGTNDLPLQISAPVAGSEFRIGATLERRAEIEAAGDFIVRGGFRTGHSLTPTAGSVTLISEVNPTWKYDAIADRMMWLEDQRSR